MIFRQTGNNKGDKEFKMQFFKSFKEKRLRLLLDEYRNTTAAGEWITPLNPDNIKIEFQDLGNFLGMSEGKKKIILNERYESKELFPFLIYKLWHIKQKRKSLLKYWFYKVFNSWKIYLPAREKEAIAEDWLVEKGYIE
jgi:hypothetical protein